MPFGFGRGGGRGGGWGRGRGFRGGRKWGWFGGGPPETCICPGCGTVVPHRRGLPCFQTKCPNCGMSMTRQFFPDQP